MGGGEVSKEDLTNGERLDIRFGESEEEER